MRPADFFAALARMRPGLSAPFAILFATVLLSGGVQMGGFLLGHGGAQLAELRKLLQASGVDLRSFAAARLLISPLTALLLWVVVWAPARIGTGPCPRLFEIVGWSRLPQLLFAPIQGVASVMLSPSDAWIFLIADLIPLCWSAALLFNALRTFQPDRATRGATFYLVTFLAILFVEYVALSGAGATGNAPAVL